MAIWDDSAEQRFYVEQPDDEGWLRYTRAVIEVRVEQTGEEAPWNEKWYTVAPAEIADQWMTVKCWRMVQVDGPARLLAEDEHAALLAAAAQASS